MESHSLLLLPYIGESSALHTILAIFLRIDNKSCDFVIDRSGLIIYNYYISKIKEYCNMEKLPQISEAEYEIMKIIWDESPISTNDVCDRVPASHNWSNKTIHTLLSRLAAKHVIAYEQRGRMYYYYPVISQKKYLSQENNHFLDRFYNGEASSLLSSLLSGSRVSDAELEKMYQLIDSKLNRGEDA